MNGYVGSHKDHEDHKGRKDQGDYKEQEGLKKLDPKSESRGFRLRDQNLSWRTLSKM